MAGKSTMRSEPESLSLIHIYKGIKEPLYCGELYIDAENNALVQARLEINPAYVLSLIHI